MFEEVRAGQEHDPTAAVALAWAIERCVPDAILPASVEHWDLGAGESQVIIHGITASRWIVLDDRAARRCAAAHGLSAIGSLGVMLRSKRLGLLDEAKPWVAELVEAGMFLDGRLLERSRDQVRTGRLWRTALALMPGKAALIL